jgi:XTP/dITP diphosphohydrolase
VTLLVVPLAPEEAGSLTLGEWDALRACERVLFERTDHPLIERLRSEGVPAGPFDDEPDASHRGWALVADPGSPRIIELARAGARVTAGVAPTPDDLTAAHASPVARRGAAALGGLAAIMARLRSDDGCPWDREQTHESLKVHLLEEAYEVIDAIDRGENGKELEEELGDLLLQVAFHARLAEQEGRFDIADVADRIAAKLVHRHPHVFGETEVAGAHEVVRNWEAIKTEEKGRTTPFEGIPRSLPALLQAAKVQKRAALHADESEARRRIEESLAADDVGDALFWLVALARARGIDPEGALHKAVGRFRSRR